MKRMKTFFILVQQESHTSKFVIEVDKRHSLSFLLPLNPRVLVLLSLKLACQSGICENRESDISTGRVTVILFFNFDDLFLHHLTCVLVNLYCRCGAAHSH